MHTNWNINVSFVIHVNFGHARMEHYPITLKEACMHAHNVLFGHPTVNHILTRILVKLFYPQFLGYTVFSVSLCVQ